MIDNTLTDNEVADLLVQRGLVQRRMTPEEFDARRRECRLKAMAVVRARYPLTGTLVRLAPPMDEDGGCALPGLEEL